MKAFLVTIVLLITSASMVLPTDVGLGTTLIHDCGYYPQIGRPWVPLPRTLRLVGRYESFFVCVESDDQVPYSEYYLLKKADFLHDHIIRKSNRKLPEIIPTIDIVDGP